jgi:hypothetical protein
VKRIAISGGLIFVALVAVASVIVFSTHFRAEKLNPAELKFKPSAPPEDPCLQLERGIASEPAEVKSNKPVRNTGALSSDEIAIYRSLMSRWSSGERVKVSSKTFPLELDRIDCACFNGMDTDAVLAASHSYRYLTRDVLPGKYARLVDPDSDASPIRDPEEGMRKGESIQAAVDKAFDSGLLSLSQIAFDKEHRHAVVSYEFYCGSLCGSGLTVIFEKVGGEWKQADQTCGGFIS